MKMTTYTSAQVCNLPSSPLHASPRAVHPQPVPSDVLLDQYYTRQGVAAYFYTVFQRYFDPKAFLLVEPTAGTGSFFKIMPAGSRGYDVDPKYPGIIKADFLTISLPTGRRIAVVGHPPFGKNASMALRFFNHAARQVDVIAMILPRTFRKSSIQNRIDSAFHLIHEELVPHHAFLFRSKPYNVPAVFQIWQRQTKPRQPHLIETTHPDFEFTTSDKADFVLQRVGARAGRVHHDFKMSPSSHLFILGPVESIMKRLNFASVAGNVAGNPSVSKSEIVALYRQFTGR